MHCKSICYVLMGGIVAAILSNAPEAQAFVGGAHWDAEAAAKGVDPTGTLPVIHIDTDGGRVIDQKEEYVPGKYWFDADGFAGYKSAGSEAKPLDIEIRGRGNSTWTNFDKKPYKIKLGKKAALLDTEKNKHYALLHFIGGYPTYFSHPLGMELGHYLIKGWTPRMRPVELVLNGQYLGLYFLAETVRVDGGRVDIAEQEPANEDPETIDGGYLVEIDNYDDVNQITFDENGIRVRVTAKTPEPMNDMHAAFLSDQFAAITAALYSEDRLSRDWEELVDIDSYARHYVVQEIIHNWDAYNGSCYLHKDFGSKWTFGPLWDVGDSFNQFKGDFVYNETPYAKTWIRQTVQFPRFIKKVQEIWAEFKAIDPQVWTDFMESWNAQIAEAEQQNQIVWDYYRGSTTADKMGSATRALNTKVAWLDTQWGEGPLTCNVTALPAEGGRILLGGHDYGDVDLFRGDDLTVKFVSAENLPVKAVYVNGADVTADVTDNTLTLSAVDTDTTVEALFGSSSIGSVDADGATGWHLDGRTVTASQPVTVYAPSGILVGQGTEVTLPAPGIWLITTPAGDTARILAR